MLIAKEKSRKHPDRAIETERFFVVFCDCCHAVLCCDFDYFIQIVQARHLADEIIAYNT